MEEINREVLEIINKGLKEEPIDSISNWNEVLTEIRKQAVYCLPYSQITKCTSLSSIEKKQYTICCLQNFAYNIQLLNAQSELVHLFNENNIPFVVLKGSAASMYYTHPEYRCSGDIDIIVKPEDYSKASKLMKENYTFEPSDDVSLRHESFRNKAGFEIELHRYFSFGKNNAKKRKLDELIYKGIDKREIHSTNGYSFPALPFKENGLVLINHIYQHLYYTGIGYRQVIDFREYVRVNAERIDEFLDFSEIVGLRGLAEIIITICNKYLGLDVTFTAKYPNNVELENELLQRFSNSGNFGNKESRNEESRTEEVLKDLRNPFYAIVQMQVYGRKNWKATDKYIILRPFAWIYQLGRYASKLKEHGGIQGIRNGSKRSNDKNQLFKDLDLPKNY